MMKCKCVLFDLDGTITDSGPGIKNSFRYAFKEMQDDTIDLDDLNRFIGPPLKYSFANICGYDDEKADRAVKSYRTYYREKGIFENTVYDGVRELIIKLHNANIKVCLATSKPEIFARQILDHFELTEYFDVIVGSGMDELGSGKAPIVKAAAEQSGADHKEIVMIGDRLHDILGAKENNLTSIGVLYGYGSREELEEVGADYIVTTIDELEELLFSELLV